MGYLFEEKFIKEICDFRSKTPFKILFKKIFDCITGLNSRKISKQKLLVYQKDIFWNIVKKCQNDALELVRNNYTEKIIRHENNKNKLVINYEIEDSYLASMIGHVPIKNKSVIVTCKPSDPLQFVAIKKPTRENNFNKLSDKIIENSITEAKSLLKTGLCVDSKNRIFLDKQEFVYLIDDKYFINNNKSDQKVEWNSYRIIKKEIKWLDPIISRKYDYCKLTGEGIDVNFHQYWKKVLDNNEVIFKRYIYDTIFYTDKILSFPNISRNGCAIDNHMNIYDIKLFNILSELCLFLPICVKAISLFKFKIRNKPVFFELIKDLKETNINSNITKINSDLYRSLTKRIPWEHQSESVSQLLENNSKGIKGNFMWIPVGMGKTAIICWYIRKLFLSDRLPDYIIYTLPKSAISSVYKELSEFECNIEIISPIKIISKNRYPSNFTVIKSFKIPKKHTLYLIEHEHLIKCITSLLNISPKMLFIVDEVHKTLSQNTLKTNSAIQLARLSEKFVAFTGTPIINNKIYQLIEWLNMTISFPVREENFFTAMNDIIFKKISTGIEIDKKNIDIPFENWDNKNLILYKSYLPPRKFGGTNLNCTQKDFKMAIDLCYRISYKFMVNELLKLLSDSIPTMVVVGNNNQIIPFIDECISNGIQKEVILGLTDNNPDTQIYNTQSSIFMDSKSVKDGTIYPYQVIVVPISKSEGYTLTYFGAMISGVYPSNNASREQIEGRINRIGQNRKKIYYRIISTGILTHILNNHNKANNLSQALKEIATEIIL